MSIPTLQKKDLILYGYLTSKPIDKFRKLNVLIIRKETIFQLRNIKPHTNLEDYKLPYELWPKDSDGTFGQFSLSIPKSKNMFSDEFAEHISTLTCQEVKLTVSTKTYCFSRRTKTRSQIIAGTSLILQSIDPIYKDK